MLATSTLSHAESNRAYKPKKHFKIDNPCPATGKTTGSCPNFIMDHRIGLCVGGADEAENLRWMTKENAKLKDRWECKAGWEEKLAECEKEANCFYPGNSFK